MIKLPTWILPHTKPAFNDRESVTVLEATHKLYGVMNELIEEQNKLNETLNKAWDDFKAATEKDYELFELSMQQAFQDLSGAIDLKLMEIENNFENEIEKATEDVAVKLAQGVVDSFNTLALDYMNTVNSKLANVENEQLVRLNDVVTFNFADGVTVNGTYEIHYEKQYLTFPTDTDATTPRYRYVIKDINMQIQGTALKSVGFTSLPEPYLTGSITLPVAEADAQWYYSGNQLKPCCVVYNNTDAEPVMLQGALNLSLLNNKLSITLQTTEKVTNFSDNAIMIGC